MSEKKLDLIAQLLAKAEKTTPEEAEALVEAATKLMVKYGIDQARIDERRAREGRGSERIIESSIPFFGTYAKEVLQMGVNVAFALGTLRPLESRVIFPKEGWRLHIVGFESDVEQALILIRSLEIQAAVAMRSWWRENRPQYNWDTENNKLRARRSHIIGFGIGAASRIRDSRESVIEEAGTGTDLVLVSRRSKVDAFVDSKFRGKSRRRQGKVDHRAAQDGHTDGRNANTGGPQVSAGRGLAAQASQ